MTNFFQFQGSPVKYFLIHSDGNLEEKILSEENPILVVKPNTWFGAQVTSKNNDPNGK